MTKNKEIPFVAYYYDIFLLILDDEVIGFDYTGGFENKPQGNNYLSKLIFSSLHDHSFLPSALIGAIIDFSENITIDEELDNDYYDAEDSFYFMDERMIKDIVGTWGPTSWSYQYGTHLDLAVGDAEYRIDHIMVEDKKIDTHIRMNGKEAFFISSNLLYFAYSWLFRTHIVQDLKGMLSETRGSNLDQICTSIDSQMKLKNYQLPEIDQDMSIYQFLIRYYSYLYHQLTENHISPHSILQYSGVSILCDLIYHDQVLSFTKNIITSNDDNLTDYTQRCLVITYLYLVLQAEEVLRYVEESGIREDTIKENYRC